MIRECKHCKKSLSIKNFRKKCGSDMRSVICNSCCKELLKEGYRVCNTCYKIYPFTNEYFNSHKSKYLGLDTTCKYCTREKVSIWMKENKDKVRKHSKDYIQTDKGKIANRMKRHRYDSRKKRLEASYTSEQWEYAKSYFGFKCAYCESEENLEQEHVVAVNNGGTYTVDNIIPSCKKCNSSKRDNEIFNWYVAQDFFSEIRLAKISKYIHMMKSKVAE